MQQRSCMETCNPVSCLSLRKSGIFLLSYRPSFNYNRDTYCFFSSNFLSVAFVMLCDFTGVLPQRCAYLFCAVSEYLQLLLSCQVLLNIAGYLPQIYTSWHINTLPFGFGLGFCHVVYSYREPCGCKVFGWSHLCSGLFYAGDLVICSWTTQQCITPPIPYIWCHHTYIMLRQQIVADSSF